MNNSFLLKSTMAAIIVMMHLGCAKNSVADRRTIAEAFVAALNAGNIERMLDLSQTPFSFGS